jgi:hypothetical protein
MVSIATLAPKNAPGVKDQVLMAAYVKIRVFGTNANVQLNYFGI